MRDVAKEQERGKCSHTLERKIRGESLFRGCKKTHLDLSSRIRKCRPFGPRAKNGHYFLEFTGNQIRKSLVLVQKSPYRAFF